MNEQPKQQKSESEQQYDAWLDETFKCSLCQNGGSPCPIHTDIAANLAQVNAYFANQNKSVDFEQKQDLTPEQTEEDIESSNRLADKEAEIARQEKAHEDYLKSPATAEDIEKMIKFLDERAS